MLSSDFSQSSGWGNLDARGAFQLGKFLVDQVEADVRRAIIERFAGSGLRQPNRVCRHLCFCQTAFLGNALDRVSITVARRKVHRAINVLRILAENSFDHTDAFDEIAPIDRAQEPKTADTVADRDLVRCLLLVLGLNQLFDRPMRFREPLLDPCQRERQRRTLPLQTARKLRDEGALHRRRRSCHVGDDEDQAFRIALCRFHHSVGPGIRHITLGPAGRDPHTDTTKILDQGKPQHDRDRPQFTKLQRGN